MQLRWSMVWVFCFALLAVLYVAIQSYAPREATLASSVDPEEIISPQGVFDRRCTVCHSCNNAPCQLNLTSFEAAQRGATQLRVYNAARTTAADPTRLGIDHHSEAAWRTAGFFSVLDEAAPSFGLLRRSLDQRLRQPGGADPLPVLESFVCSKDAQSLDDLYKKRPLAGMPYGLPALNTSEYGVLDEWLRNGAPAYERTFNLSSEEKNARDLWTDMLNGTSNEQRLVARYVYEHLFLAHVNFAKDSRSFHRLVRSSTQCDVGVTEIPSRRPNDDPGASFYYCFIPYTNTIVEKTHLPYLLDRAKLAWTQRNFFGSAWHAQQLPGYDEKTAANPFRTFEAIPVIARYRFLLEDAYYHIGTFIKGPVCNGNAAVNSIDEQFYVFFYRPDADLMVRDPQFQENAKDLLILPAENGSNDGKLDIISNFSKYPPVRNKYRTLRQQVLKAQYPDGLSLNELWDGDGTNDNALLTVLRHDDNAYVMKGARGDAARTAYVLDYALFERLVYNLAVGFDVYGNITHQLHTRVYMGMIRMEGESNYLDFFPPEYRQAVRDDWYGSSRLGKLEKFLIDAPIPNDNVSHVTLPAGLTPAEVRVKMDERILGERLGKWAQLRPDTINWKSFSARLLYRNRDAVEDQLAKLTAQPASQAPWVSRFPDVAMIAVRGDNGATRVFTAFRNKRFSSIGSLLFEKRLRDAKGDTLQIVEGVAASYPNYFFMVPEKTLPSFVKAIQASGDDPTWTLTRMTWGVNRSRSDFWAISDQIQSAAKRSLGIEAGVLDYTHYDVWNQ